MRKLLALSILVSTALTGCGSGGSDGGSSSSPSTPAVQKYTFEFVKMVLAPAPETTCTIFDGTGQNYDTKYYANIAEPQRVEIHGADGSFLKKLTVSNGKVNFSVDDVPDAGYVSVIDYRAGNPAFQALSIQKELLGDYLIRINGGVSGSCYKKEHGVDTKTGYAAVKTPNGMPSNYFKFETVLSSTQQLSDRTKEVKAYKDEKVLAKAYDGQGNNLIGYAFVSTLAPVEGDADAGRTTLKTVADDLLWSATTLDLNNLDELTINLAKGDYIYPWHQAEMDKSTNTPKAFPYVSTETDWFFRAKGSMLGWNFVHNADFTNEFDVSLLTDLSAGNIEIKDDSGYVFAVSGLISSDQLIQRSYYYTESNSGPASTLTHTIYSVPNSDGEVAIPALAFDNDDINLVPSEAGVGDIAVSVVAKGSIDAGFKESFMRSYQPNNPRASVFSKDEDAVSLVLTPGAQAEQRKAMQMSTYTLVER
jgi:hypothetical protein